MSGVIKKLYHPNTPNGGTVTTDNSSQTLQEIYPIVATTGVVSPQGSFREGNNLDQILTWLNSHKQDTLVGTQTTGQNLKTLTINGTEVSLLGTGTISIQGGGGGGGDSDFFELDASGNLHVKNDRGLYTGSFISAGGVGSGGGGGGSNTLEGLDDTVITSPSTAANLQSLIYSHTINKWVNGINYRGVSILHYNYVSTDDTTYHSVLGRQNSNDLALWIGDGINIVDYEGTGHTTGHIKISVRLQSNGGLAFNNDGELYYTGGSSSIAAGDGLQLTGSTMSIKLATNSGLTFDSGGLKVTGGTGSDSWRNLTVNGSTWKGTGTSTGAVNFKNGSDISITSSGNDLTIALDRTSLDGRFVHLSGDGTNSSAEESITGLKTFLSGIALNPNTDTVQHTIYYDTQNRELVITGPVRIDGNLYATGSIAAGAAAGI